MAHFAELDDDGVVLRVVVVNNDDMRDADGNEVEALGQAICLAVCGGFRWVQCSYNGNFRGCYPGPGYRYDQAADVFLPPAVDDSAAPVG